MFDRVLKMPLNKVTRKAHIFEYLVSTLPSKKWIRKNQINKCMFKVNNRNPRKGCEIRSKLTINTRRHWCLFGAFIVNFEYISRLFLVFDFEQINICWLRGSYFMIWIYLFIFQFIPDSYNTLCNSKLI